MKKFLVIGNPIDHSLSPKLHNYWIKQNKIDYESMSYLKPVVLPPLRAVLGTLLGLGDGWI